MGSKESELDPIPVVLAGGKGTRSSNPNIPKLLQELSPGFTLGEWMVSHLAAQGFSEVHYLLGHMSEQIIPNLESWSRDHNLGITWTVETNPRGTAREIISCARGFSGRDLLVILGDTLSDAPFRSIVNNWRRGGARFGVGTHVASHSGDSDLVSKNINGEIRSFRLKGVESPADGHIYSTTTLALANADALADLDVISPDFIQSVLHQSTREPVAALRVPGLSMDVGTPERLRSARDAFAARSASTSGLALFVDRDGTLIPDIGTNRKTVDSREILRPTINFLRRASRAGVKIFLVSNQPGIAKGHTSFDEVEAVFSRLEQILWDEGVTIYDFKYCPHHPERGHQGEISDLKVTCLCRKPSVGLVEELIQNWQVEADPEKCLVIGDSTADSEMANTLGFGYLNVSLDAKNLDLSVLPQNLYQNWRFLESDK